MEGCGHSEKLGTLAAALAKVQGQIKGAVKDSANPFFKSKYADLMSVWDACRAALSANNIAVVQRCFGNAATVCVRTRLIHSSGEWIEDELAMTAKDATPQSIGSAITYARRYGLSAMVGVAPEDDDAESAQPRQAAPAISMPRAKPVASAPVPAAAQPETEAQIEDMLNGASEDFEAPAPVKPKAVVIPDNAKRVTGLIGTITGKPKSDGTGMYYITSVGSVRVTIFSDTVADVARQAHEGRWPAEVVYTEKEKSGNVYCNVVDIQPVKS